MFKSSDGFRKFKDGLRGKLLWQYWQAFKSTAWEIFWGASVIGIAFGIYTLFYAPSKLLLLLYLLGVSLVAGYYTWRADHVRLQQKLCITKVYEQKWMIVPEDQAVAYYFEVVNRSEAETIHGVHVQLENMIPEVENLNWLPIPLRQKHDNPLAGTDYKRDFDLNPSERKHIDFVSAHCGGDHFDVEHIAGAGINRSVPVIGQDHHRLRVMITAQDMPVLYVWFDVWMNHDGVLQCEMES
jgi:hypothetical protein